MAFPLLENQCPIWEFQESLQCPGQALAGVENSRPHFLQGLGKKYTEICRALLRTQEKILGTLIKVSGIQEESELPRWGCVCVLQMGGRVKQLR